MKAENAESFSRDKHTQQIKVEKLAAQLLLYKKQYYAGKPTISDEAYDSIEDELKELSPQHPVLSIVGSTTPPTNKVTHSPAMLSLAKTYKTEDLLTFISKHESVCIDKMDGMAMALEYDAQGKLFRASTRGDGDQGEDVTEHVYLCSQIPKKIQYPQEWNNKVTKMEVRGEAYFPISEFPAFEELFDSYRNAVPGTFGRKEPSSAADVLGVIGFCAFELLVDEKVDAPQSYQERLKILDGLGFFCKSHQKLLNENDLANLSTFIDEWFKKPRDYQIDGIVFRFNDQKLWESLGSTSHHPRGSIAFKRQSEVAVTQILEIEPNVGRSGKISFRAKLDPVQLSGAKISFATLHNADFIETGKYAVGAKVRITRSGEVIPSIIGLVEPADKEYELPKTCLCGSPLQRLGPDLYCLDNRSCAFRDRESLVHFVRSLNILGISDKFILKIMNAGLIQIPADLFRIKESDLAQLSGLGEKSAKNIVTAIQEKKGVPLSEFLTALGLKRGGEVKCKEAAQKYVTLEAILEAKPEELAKEKGWAEKSAEEFLGSLQDKREVVNQLQKVMTIYPEEAIQVATGHPLNGKNICITGSLSRPRDEYKKELELLGAKVTDSVSSKTHFLVCNEDSGSKKSTQAKKLNIPILKEGQLQTLIATV